MKVLIAAYACEPGKGSEPGIGWDWSTSLARRTGLDVTVITRENNRQSIEVALQSDPPKNLHFIYHDLPDWLQKLKKCTHSIYPYYLLWCLSIRRKARDLSIREKFDVFHHLTFSTDWLPGCIPPQIDCATILGPLGGYDTAPEIRKLIPGRYVLKDYLRKAVRTLGLYLRRKEFRRCDMLIANNGTFGRQYQRLAPNSAIETISTQLSAGPMEADTTGKATLGPGEPTTILMAGRMLYWKGLDAALDALCCLKDDGLDFRAVLIGNGPSDYVMHLKEKCERLGLGRQVRFVGNLPRDEFLAQMATADMFLYPTLYGTADSIMIESVERNVPIVCFPSPGAIELLGDDYPYTSKDFTPASLAEQMKIASSDSDDYQAARSRLLLRHAPENKISQIEMVYRRALESKHPLKELALLDA